MFGGAVDPDAGALSETDLAARVARIADAIEALPGLSITGNGLRGVAFADAATDGIRVGDAAVLQIGASMRLMPTVTTGRSPYRPNRSPTNTVLGGAGFTVLPYMNADPVLARRLAAIGSGRGILTRANLEIIIEEAEVPVVVDAGLGVPSEAAAAMEMGADAVLVNTALAEARDPVRMARASAQTGGIVAATDSVPTSDSAGTKSA